MPAPMPPGAPAAPSAPPDQQGQGGGSISNLLQSLGQGLDHVNTVVQQSKAVSPPEKQMLAQCNMLYGKFMDSIGAGGEPDEDDQAGQSQAQGQTVSPEAQGNPGARPAP